MGKSILLGYDLNEKMCERIIHKCLRRYIEDCMEEV